MADVGLDAKFWKAVGTDGHCLHESGHAVMAALCDFRVDKIVFSRTDFDAHERSPVFGDSGELSEVGNAWKQSFDECRKLSKPRRLAMTALSGLICQFMDVRGHPKVPMSMRSAGEKDVQFARQQFSIIAENEACPYAQVRTEIKTLTHDIFSRDCVRKVLNDVSDAYRRQLLSGISGDEFYATIKRRIFR